ncbi:hypothetical protein [Streptomyces sp. AC558_RSS880]|uniref:hypothetical protein n=1 Tax=Streptomyces sp. AC558_RSS880 TaxID=2823687 RepID=UPI001C236E2E|nr:hypothetical protein [Streptomyces sp. AC558_RSS880]
MTMTAITHARVFGGEWVREETTVVLDGPAIAAIGGEVPAGAETVDARGGTLLSGLFDAHTHTSKEAPAFALRSGATTEPETQGVPTGPCRAHTERNDPGPPSCGDGTGHAMLDGVELALRPARHDDLGRAVAAYGTAYGTAMRARVPQNRDTPPAGTFRRTTRDRSVLTCFDTFGTAGQESGRHGAVFRTGQVNRARPPLVGHDEGRGTPAAGVR